MVHLQCLAIEDARPVQLFEWYWLPLCCSTTSQLGQCAFLGLALQEKQI